MPQKTAIHIIHFVGTLSAPCNWGPRWLMWAKGKKVMSPPGHSVNTFNSTLSMISVLW